MLSNYPRSIMRCHTWMMLTGTVSLVRTAVELPITFIWRGRWMLTWKLFRKPSDASVDMCRLERPLYIPPAQGPQLPSLRVPPAGRRRRMHRGAADRPETTVLDQEALGQYTLLQERTERHWLRHRKQRDAHYTGDSWRSRKGSGTG